MLNVLTAKKCIKFFDIMLFLFMIIYTVIYIVKSVKYVEYYPKSIVINVLIISSICTVVLLTYINLTHDRNHIMLQILPFLFLILQHMILSAVIPFLGYTFAENNVIVIENYRTHANITKFVILFTTASFAAKYIIKLFEVVSSKYSISITRKGN